MIKINWKYGRDCWAFKNLCKHLQKKLTSFIHCDNSEHDDSDISFLVSPSQANKEKCNSLTIIHIDSNRWYGGDKNENIVN